MKKYLVAFMLLGGCTNDDATVSTLQAEGYTQIRTTGWQFGCGNDDDSCTGFEAIGPTGRHVIGVVGCGWGPLSKGCTVRIGK